MQIPNVRAELIMECVQAVALGFDSFKKIVGYVHKKEFTKVSSYFRGQIRNCMEAARSLGLLIFDGNPDQATVSLAPPLQSGGWTNGMKAAFFRERLQRFEPYLKFHELILLGDDSDSAARRVSALLEITPMIKGTNNVLSDWGLYAKTLTRLDGKVVVDPSLTPSALQKGLPNFDSYVKSLDNELAARSYILEFLGQKVYDFLTGDIKTDLAKAMGKVTEAPDQAVVLFGTALDDYLKSLASSRGIPLVDAKGKPLNMIGTIIDKLREGGVLAKHHVNALKGLEVFTSSDLFHGLNAYRTMPVHGRDLEEDRRWSLSSEVALVSIFQLLLTIRSTYYYVVERKLTY